VKDYHKSYKKDAEMFAIENPHL